MDAMKKQVVLYKQLSAPLMARLQAQTDVTLIEEPNRDGLARLRAALPGAHGLLGASLKLDADLLDLAPKLEAVSSVSVGVDNYDLAYLDRRGVVLSNTPDVLTETTADTLFADPGDGTAGGGAGQSGSGRAVEKQHRPTALRHGCTWQDPGDHRHGPHW